MERDDPLATEAGLAVSAVYGPETAKLDLESIGDPGSFPFTRGNFAGGYRDKLWTFR